MLGGGGDAGDVAEASVGGEEWDGRGAWDGGAA